MEPSVTNHLHSPYVPLLGQEVSAGIRADYCAQSGEKEGLQVQQKGGDPHREAADPRPGRRLRAGGSECGLSTSTLTAYHRRRGKHSAGGSFLSAGIGPHGAGAAQRRGKLKAGGAARQRAGPALREENAGGPKRTAPRRARPRCPQPAKRPRHTHTHTHPSPPPAAHLLVPALTGLPSPRSALTALREGRPRRRAPCGSSKQEEPQRSVPRGPAAGLQLPAGSGAVRSGCVGEKRFCTARAVRRLPAPRGFSGGTSATAAPLTDVSVLS